MPLITFLHVLVVDLAIVNGAAGAHPESDASALRGRHTTLPVQAPSHAIKQLHQGEEAEALRTLHQYKRLKKLKPILWLHIPRCGSSFANVLIHHPGICKGIPKDLWISASEHPLSDFFVKYPKEKYCKGGFQPRYFYKDPPGHDSIGPLMDYYPSHVRHHAVTMLRQPEQRIMSAYYNHHMGVYSHIPTFKEYARFQEGCMVKMFVRPNYRNPEMKGSLQGPCLLEEKKPSPPSQDEVDLAIHRLRTDIAFVGITDEWDLSICLFHAMFGGHCRKRMFEDVRPWSHVKRKQGYDLSPLQGFVDKGDGALYAEAQKIFQSNLHLYGVNKDTCPSACQKKKHTSHDDDTDTKKDDTSDDDDEDNDEDDDTGAEATDDDTKNDNASDDDDNDDDQDDDTGAESADDDAKKNNASDDDDKDHDTGAETKDDDATDGDAKDTNDTEVENETHHKGKYHRDHHKHGHHHRTVSLHHLRHKA